MNTWKVILATAVIFIAGAVSGGLVVRYAFKCQAAEPAKIEPHQSAVLNPIAAREKTIPPPLMGPLRRDFIGKLERELQIDPTQRECIERIICDGQEQTRLIWLEVEPDIYQTIVCTKDRIRATLTEEQKARFQEMLKPRGSSTHSASDSAASAMTNAAPAKP